jgi:hypothetical protein
MLYFSFLNIEFWGLQNKRIDNLSSMVKLSNKILRGNEDGHDK